MLTTGFEGRAAEPPSADAVAEERNHQTPQAVRNGERIMMAEQDFVTRDQHRADLAELRLELANTLASLDKRTELIAQDLMSFRREMQSELGSLRRDMQQGLSDLRQEMGAFRSDTRREVDSLRQEIGAFRSDTRREADSLRQEMRDFRTTTTRQMWTMVSVVAFAVLTGVIKLVFFP